MDPSAINLEALKTEIRDCVINPKANACPMVIRLAWHAAGTYNKNTGSGGTNGATMRFEPESTDNANAGLHIIRNMLQPVKANHPELSYADVWTFAGTAAVEFLGGPKIHHHFGRSDAPNGSTCPVNGLLPDAAQGAAHLREVFYRMGFNDQEIVALSGAHTLGRCHLVRSGYDGPWTRNPLKFDNAFFKNLIFMEWRPRKWEGPLQFEDVDTGDLMMLPTDMALKTDPQFRVFAELYAKDEPKFFNDFSFAFAKLLALGAPPAQVVKESDRDKASADFREAAMHGSLPTCQKLAPRADVHAVEKSSQRSALHKAAFWGHDGTVRFLINECKLNIDAQDFNGDTALHDAVRFDHPVVVQFLLDSKADPTIKNKHGLDVVAVAQQYGHTKLIQMLQNHSKSKL